MRLQMDCMDRDEMRCKQVGLGQELDRTAAGLRDALVDLELLLGHVHMEGQPVLRGVVAERSQPSRRNGANRMRCDPDDNVGVTCPTGSQCVDVAQHGVRVRVAESALVWLGGPPGPRPVVGCSKESNAKTRLLRGLDHCIGHRRSRFVRRAIRLVMDVMKLADGPNPSPSELPKGDETDVMDGLRRQ